ncbi:MAG: alpha-D-glucose phosphate-specific phosphoglucomutase, partial [Anaerolineae bacterium]|nr:alpha-D-glucose phosphate-specific phosphoglucomutase [Anaerolineae bacterium]
MAIHPLAGQPAPRELLSNIPRLITAYYAYQPDPDDPAQQVAFGTSGHRGTSLNGKFNEQHIAAISQAIAELRLERGITGPLFIGQDSHPLSEPALTTAIEVLAANGVRLVAQSGGGYTPTPVISHAILTYNEGKTSGLADGVVITPSHNPPDDGGFKYNPPSAGPADTETTKLIQNRANALIRGGLKDVRRMPYAQALKAETTQAYDYITPYVSDLANVIDMAVIKAEGLKIGVDPMGGASVAFWEPLAERYGLNLEIVNRFVDPTFSFMTLDHDGKIRMDCSSPYAMASLIQLKDR